MRFPLLTLITVGAVAAVWAVPLPAAAQPLGSFTWQLQPFCNRVTVNVRQDGAVYTLDGFDDQCGAAQKAPLVGLATPNPDGTIGFGLNIVASGGKAVSVDARVSLAGLGGTWTDSAGNSGAFAFGANTGGSPRPPAGVGLGDVTAVLAGTGLSGGGASGDVTLSVNTTAIQTRVTGACAAGEAVRTVNADGSVVCQGVGSGDITAVTAGTGLTGGATTGNATLAIQAGGVTNALLATAAVDAAKIASGAITSAKIAADAVTSTHIAANAINDTTQIATGAITVNDLGRAASAVGTTATTVPARSCVTRLVTALQVAKGSLMLMVPGISNPVMPGLSSIPMVAMDDGPFVYQVCNGTTSDVTTGFSFVARVMAP